MERDGEIRVLHVDDDPEFGDVAAMHLERVDERIGVVSERNACDGLERLRAEPFDCVVSDHDMPSMDGLAFLKAVRDEFPSLPFILFTGKGNEEIASDAISAGVTEYLQKDVGTEQYTVLANRIRRAVGETRAKAALRESERQLSTLISNLPGMVYRARNEPQWPMEFVSGGTEELVGYTSETLESGEVMWGDIVVDPDTDTLWEQIQASLVADEPFEVTYRVETADGETRWVWERGRVVDTSEAGVEVLEGFITDITARKEREQELEQERQFTETLVDAIDDVFYLVSPDGELLRWNDTALEVTGYSHEEMTSMHAFDLFPEAYHDVLRKRPGETIQTGHMTVEVPVETKDGEWLPYEFRGSLIEEPNGDVLGVAGIARDITERTERERELERYETIVEAVDDPVYTLDDEGVFTFVNEAIEPMTGYSPTELVGEHIGVVMTDEGLERGEQTIQDLLADDDADSGTLEMDVVTRSGERIPSENNMALLPTSDGEFAGTAGVIRDIAERKEREERLAEFASVVSHDLRNPLNVVQGRIALASETGDIDHLDDAASAADQMEQLIEDLLSLARQGEIVGTTKCVDVGIAAEQAWANTDTGGATIEYGDTRTVEADPARLRELFENLFRNSVTHGAGHSRSTADAAVEQEPNEGESPAGDVTITVGTLAEGDATTGFFVADDGSGIPPSKRDTVLERGYTTSENGTGFGLAIVADIASAHGWSVEVTESETGGARFEFRTTPADR